MSWFKSLSLFTSPYPKNESSTLGQLAQYNTFFYKSCLKDDKEVFTWKVTLFKIALTLANIWNTFVRPFRRSPIWSHWTLPKSSQTTYLWRNGWRSSTQRNIFTGLLKCNCSVYWYLGQVIIINFPKGGSKPLLSLYNLKR